MAFFFEVFAKKITPIKMQVNSPKRCQLKVVFYYNPSSYLCTSLVK